MIYLEKLIGYVSTYERHTLIYNFFSYEDHFL